MRAKDVIFALTAIATPTCILAQGVAELAAQLSVVADYTGNAKFEVYLPSAEDPVVYNVTLQSHVSELADTLAPCDYLIRWEAETPGGKSDGFSAYFAGNHYRYRNNRLQEYHMESNPAPFAPNGAGSAFSNGVQCTVQFADLLPQFIGRKIDTIIADSSYIYKYTPDTIVNGKAAYVLKGVKRTMGYDALEFTYVFDPVTKLPIMSEFENNPGSISEQTVSVHYTTTNIAPIELSEEGLIDEWPEVFERYRESSFRAENLVGARLPSFACQTIGGERYAHQLDEGFASPTIIVILDPEVSTAQATIGAIREAVDMLPMNIDVIWAFGSNRIDDIKAIVGDNRHGETTLNSARSLIRNCGIALTPTTIIVDRDAKIHDVIPGYNNELSSVVIQKAMLIK